MRIHRYARLVIWRERNTLSATALKAYCNFFFSLFLSPPLSTQSGLFYFTMLFTSDTIALILSTFHSIPFLGLLLLIRFIACVREYKNQHNIILMHSQVFSDSNDLYVFGMYLVRLMCLDNEKHRKVPVFLLLKCIGMYRLVAHYFREYIKSNNLNNNNNNKRLRAIFYQSIIIIVICTCCSFIYTIENSSKKSINFVLCYRYWMYTCSVIQSFPCKPHQ